MLNYKFMIGSSIVASLLLVGCGSSSSSDTTSTVPAPNAKTGYLVDSAVSNADYDCIADQDYNKTTGANGEFSCQDMSQVRFRLGNLILGEVSVNEDGYVLPQDLLGIARENTLSDSNVIALAQLLQSLDSDANTTNGIQITNETKSIFDEEEEFNAQEVNTYINEVGVLAVDAITAQSHLRDTLQTLNIGTNYNNTDPAQGHGHGNSAGNGTQGNTNIPDVTAYPTSTLTPELKDALAHMGNEERLAYDVYNNLYNYHANQGEYIMQLSNIAQNGEKTHVLSVQALVQKYNLSADELSVVDSSIVESNNMSNSISFDSMPSGVYDIPAIQALYDTLYNKGVTSAKDALEVGCMVEVTDINDLDDYIALAQESNASDVEAVFTNLRSGSYSHYWAFDQGLKNIGVEDGCCSLGNEWCHYEYPQSNH